MKCTHENALIESTSSKCPCAEETAPWNSDTGPHAASGLTAVWVWVAACAAVAGIASIPRAGTAAPATIRTFFTRISFRWRLGEIYVREMLFAVHLSVILRDRPYRLHEDLPAH